jgi:hypothetical protein
MLCVSAMSLSFPVEIAGTKSAILNVPSLEKQAQFVASNLSGNFFSVRESSFVGPNHQSHDAPRLRVCLQM